jgi:hypothetical protein
MKIGVGSKTFENSNDAFQFGSSSVSIYDSAKIINSELTHNTQTQPINNSNQNLSTFTNPPRSLWSAANECRVK